MALMKTYVGVLITIVIVIVILALATWGPIWFYREKPDTKGAAGTREHYGEPPGNVRAVNHSELGYRGWADAPPEYQGRTVSAISHMVERSA
jgi:hypothetical protein